MRYHNLLYSSLLLEMIQPLHTVIHEHLKIHSLWQIFLSACIINMASKDCRNRSWF